MKRIVFLTGIAFGYVLGTRAGRQRYETIARTARSVADRPEVQGVAGILRARVGGVVTAIVPGRTTGTVG
ncbi:MAG TPA: hypothetical protein VHC41_01385 [Mycobacteriales bacterium]|jgi:hypothetical protein|nr:hypothetical protein [Mycobacteriales bacterium]